MINKAYCRSCKYCKYENYPISAVFDYEYYRCKIDNSEIGQSRLLRKDQRFSLNRNGNCNKHKRRFLALPWLPREVRWIFYGMGICIGGLAVLGGIPCLIILALQAMGYFK